MLGLRNAPVAQLDRAAASEAVGQKFESSRAHHSLSYLIWFCVVPIGRDRTVQSMRSLQAQHDVKNVAQNQGLDTSLAGRMRDVTSSLW